MVEIEETGRQGLGGSGNDECAPPKPLSPAPNLTILICAATETALASHRARFDQVFSALFFAVTSGAQWGIVWWYRRQPVVWMPAGWMPAYAESLLNVGGAPKGMSHGMAARLQNHTHA